MKSLRTFIDSFCRQERGNIVIIAALLLAPTFALLGFAVDISAASKTKAELRDLMDSAALAGVNRNAISQNSGTYSPANSKKLTDEFLTKFLSENISRRLTSLNYETTATQDKDGVITLSIKYVAEIDTAFHDLIGRTSMTIEDRVTATSAPPTFLEVIMLVDASSSMMIGASKSDQDIMRKVNGCAFACHVQNANALNNAHKHGAKVRLDVVKEAIAGLIDDAKKMQIADDQYAFSLYKFSLKLTEVKALTTDMNGFKAAAMAMAPPLGPEGGTNFRYSMQQLNAKLSDSGSGISKDNRRKVLMVFTDGVATPVWYSNAPKDYNWRYDVNTVFWGPRVHWAYGFNAADCNQFKNKRITVATLYTEYINTDSGSWGGLDKTLIPLNKTNLRLCASTEALYFTANNADDIHRASESMFKSVVSRSRIIE
jgi:Flp pilus assembly protein TadG